jgi:ParB/RepB/Spo0J family partition protein
MAKRKQKETAGTAVEVAPEIGVVVPPPEIVNYASNEAAQEADAYLHKPVNPTTAGSSGISGISGISAGGRTIISVDAESVLLDPVLRALRRWNGTGHELSIPELARTILEETQQSPCVCRVNADGDLVLVEGARRKAAVQWLKENGEKVVTEEHPEGEDVLLDVVVVEMGDDEALRRACLENIQRADFTKLELADNIQLIRKRFGWEGRPGTAEVAGFLGVSPATVTETEKFLNLPKEMQEDVQAGRLTPNAALEWLNIQGEEKVKAEVMERAKEIADEEAKEKEEKRRKNEEARRRVVEARQGKGGKGKAGAGVTGTGKAQARKTGAEGVETGASEFEEGEEEESLTPVQPYAPTPPPLVQGKVTSQHVRKAARKEGVGGDKPKAPRIGEMCDLMDQWNSPAAYPEVMCRMAGALSEWGHGKLGDKKLKAAWGDLADAVHVPQPKKAAVASKAGSKAKPKKTKKKVLVPAKKKAKKGKR